MGSACFVEGVPVLLLMEVVHFRVNGESGFVRETFQLPALSFELAEVVSVPGGGVVVGDGLGFDGGELVEAGGQCVVVVVNQVCGGGV